MQPPPSTQARRPARPRRVARGLALTAALLVLLVGAGIAANMLLAKPAPPPLWTESDLPAIPPPAANGWTLIQDQVAVQKLPAIPPVLTSMTDVTPGRSAEVAWGDVRTQQPAITAHVTDPSHASWYRVIDEAQARPVFADGCPVRIDAVCELLPVFRAHQMLELSVLNDALAGRWNEAFDETTRMVSVDIAFAASSRSLLSTMIALRRCTRVVNLADVVLAGAAAAGPERGALSAERAQALRAALGSLREQDIDLQHAVISEYLLGLDGLAVVQRSPGALTAGKVDFGPFARFMLDSGDTVRMLNEDYRALAEFARSPSGPLPPPPPLRASGLTWWAHNAVGKLLLDTVHAELPPLIKRAADERAALLLRRDAVQARIALPTTP